VKALSSAEITALSRQALSFRNLVWITAKTRVVPPAVPALVSIGFWDDVGTRSLAVIDALTGATVTRSFVGAGSLLSVDDVVSTAELTVQELSVMMSGIDATVANAVRGYDARLAPVQVYRLLLDPASGNVIAPARCRFVGIVDSLSINDPPPNGTGVVTLRCVSQMRELTRANPDMTSDDSQKLRAELPATTDRFYEYSNAVTKWVIAWGSLSVKGLRKQDKKDRDD
jgi:hypothetical protein